VGTVVLHLTALVGMRTRLHASARPRRVFEGTKAVAAITGAMKQGARVLDAAGVFDEVATQNTVTQAGGDPQGPAVLEPDPGQMCLPA
jgi:hypothetical protein